MRGNDVASLGEALESFYRARASERLPLAGAEESLRGLRDAVALHNHARLGDQLWSRGAFAEARAEYEAGVRNSDGEDRAPFLFALAVTSRKLGRTEEALGLADAGLALMPSHPAGRALRDALLLERSRPAR
jgi:tetratricopeptide (TPR) repeat protein